MPVEFITVLPVIKYVNKVNPHKQASIGDTES